MPFVEQARRGPLLDGSLTPEAPGDLCFIAYAEIMRRWKENPRWTTIHKIFSELLQIDDKDTALFLALLEFYVRHAHEYENEKVKQNGDI